jgi:hypothetical protein
MASESQFRASIASWMIVLVADLVVAWALYLFLKPVSVSLSLLTAWFRLVYVAIAAGAVLRLFGVLELLSGADEAAAFRPDQLAAQAMRFLRLYDYGYKVGFVFFGLHIFGLGYLIARSEYVPGVLAILLIIASVGYFIDSFSSVLSSNYANNQIMTLLFVAVPAIIAELSLTLWLLIWGG